MTLDPIDFARRNITFFTDKEAPEEKNLGKINYVMRKNGLWEVRKNSIATFYVNLCSHELLGFAKDENPWCEGFTLHVPKIPKELLDQTVAFFKAICSKIKAEAYVQYVFNTATQKYKVVCPKQEVSGARVSYEPTTLGENELLVCEIHSHNTMDAFFSSVDNDDERSRGDRFFGVIGQLDRVSPAMKLSFYSGGRHRVEVNTSDVFDISPPDSGFPDEWVSQVVERKYVSKESTAKYKDYRKDTGVLFERFVGGSDFDVEEFKAIQQQNLGLMLAEDSETDNEEEEFDTMYYARGRPKKAKTKQKASPSRVKTLFRNKGNKA